MTPGSRWAPPRTVVPPGTIRQRPAAGAAASPSSTRGGACAESADAVAERRRGRRVPQSRGPGSRNSSGCLPSPPVSTRQPLGAVGSGPAARRRPASSSARSSSQPTSVAPARGRRRSCSAILAAAARRGPGAATSPQRRPAARPRSSRVPARRRAAAAAGGVCRLDEAHRAPAPPSPAPGSGRQEVGPEQSGSQRSWRRRASSQSPRPGGRAQGGHLARDLVADATETTPSPPSASSGSVHASSPASTAKPRGRSRRIGAICSRFRDASLTRDDRGWSASRSSVPPRRWCPSGRARCRRRSAGRRRRRPPGSAPRASAGRAGCSTAPRPGRRRHRGRRPGASRRSSPPCRSCRCRRRRGSRVARRSLAATSTVDRDEPCPARRG